MHYHIEILGVVEIPPNIDFSDNLKMSILKILKYLGMIFLIILAIVWFFHTNSNPIIYSSEYSIENENLTINYTTDNLGINLPWLDTHDGKVEVNWLNTNYNSELIDTDLAVIQKMGITKVRSFCLMESIYNYNNGQFIMNDSYAKNLDDFLNRANKHGISVICVIGTGGGESGEKLKDLDGQFHWELIQSPEGIQTYKNAYISYINHFKNHTNILMWEIMNEPYGSSDWFPGAKILNITPIQVHTFLVQSYQGIKPLAGNVPVGFSDYEEEEQSKYQLFSNPEKVKTLVDDCTDIYAMHIYRNNASQVANFSNLTVKPKWVDELGAYNYYDTKPINHPIPAYNELFDTEKNYIAVTQISKKLLDSGFTLIMPWSFTSNNGMVTHNTDGSHTLLKLSQFMEKELKNNKENN